MVIGAVNLPSLSIETIGLGTFYSSGISEVRNLGGATIIASGSQIQGAFSKCPNLTICNIENITNIGDYAFYLSDMLESVTLSDNLESIGVNAFGYCTGMTKFDIPQSVTSIGYAAFMNCVNLKTFIVRAVTPPSINGNSLAGSTTNLSIYVPDDSVEAYKQASGWINYAEKIYPLSEYVEGEEDEVTE